MIPLPSDPSPRGMWGRRLGFAVAAVMAAWPVFAEAAQDYDRLQVREISRYTEELKRGVAAFRQGDLSGAAGAFSAAYQIRPSDPTLRSWMALVQDEQERRHTMGREVSRAEQRLAQRDRDAEPEDPFSLSSPDEESPAAPASQASRFGLGRLVTPVQQTRPEIQEAGKRAGFERLYKEGIGFQPIPGIGLSSRVEIFEEPNPIDDYVIEAKILNLDNLSEFRKSLLPLSTRAWAGRVVADYQPWPRLTYEYDERHILHEFQTRFNFKDRNLQTHAVNALYTIPHLPLLGSLTLNPWYKRVLQGSDQDSGTFEHRDEFLLNVSAQPTETVEYFFQYDTYGANKTQTVGGSKLQLFKGQVRLRVPALKLFMIPSYEYSLTTFDPGDDVFTKKDLFVDWGFDITPHLRASLKEQLVLSEVSQPGKEPSNPSAEVFNATHTLSYELFKDFDVSVGFDYGKSIGLSAYNNVGLRAEVALFKPGLIRTALGYEWLAYYNIDDSLSLVYWRIFLFQ